MEAQYIVSLSFSADRKGSRWVVDGVWEFWDDGLVTQSFSLSQSYAAAAREFQRACVPASNAEQKDVAVVYILPKPKWNNAVAVARALWVR